MEKRYLISFYATLKGDKVVTSGLKQIESGQGKLAKSTKRAATEVDKFNKRMLGAAKRALYTIPLWLLLRGAMMGLIRTFSDMVRANIDLEEGMARIQTVMQGTESTVRAQMVGIKRQILDTSASSKLSLKDLSEAYYFLKTASLSASEATAAFTATTDAMVGTGANAKEMARAIAGVYNTMGKYILIGATAQEKFKRIADTLTYTYATQDVEMSELLAGYTKLAPYVGGLSDSFEDLVTMIGFLNTRMLRAGRTGRLTARTILQLTKNAKQLAHTFGITFDPKQPINFINTISQINDKLKTGGKLTARQSELLRKIFATRGAVAPRLLLEDFDGLTESIKNANENLEGFAERMKEIRMGTISAQMARTKNILAVLTNEFISGVYGVGDFANALKDINNNLETLKAPFRDIGNRVGFLFEQFSKSVLITEKFLDNINKIKQPWKLFVPSKGSLAGIEAFTKIFEETPYLKIKGFEEYVKRMAKATDSAKAEGEEREKIAKIEEDLVEQTREAQITKSNALSEEKETIRHIVALMKQQGASTLDIARYKLQALKTSEIIREEEELHLATLKAENSVLEAQDKYRASLLDKLADQEIALLKTRGASEVEAISYTIALKKSLGIQQSELEVLNDQLKLEKAISAEKLNQNKTSSETVELWKLAKRYGLETAKNIGTFLRGEIGLKELDEFSRRILKRTMKGRFEQAEAGEWARRAFGRRDIMKPGVEMTRAVPEARQRVEERFISVAPTIPISTIVQVAVDSKRISDAVIRTISDSIRDKASDIRQAIDEAIKSF